MKTDNSKDKLFEVMSKLDKTFKPKLNENIEEGFGKNLAVGALMTAATLGNMSNADAGNRKKPETQQTQPTKKDLIISTKSDSVSFKAYGFGNSQDYNIAKKIAMMNARTKIAQEMGGGTQNLNNVEIENELALKTADGYKFYVVLTMPKLNENQLPIDGDINKTEYFNYELEKIIKQMIQYDYSYDEIMKIIQDILQKQP